MSFKTRLLQAFVFIVLIPVVLSVFVITLYTHATIQNNNEKNVDGLYTVVDENITERLTSIQNLVAYAYLDQDLLNVFSETQLLTPYETSVQLREDLDQFNMMAAAAIDSVEDITFYTESPLTDVRQSIKALKQYPYLTTKLGHYGYDEKKESLYYATPLKTSPNTTIMVVTIKRNEFFPENILKDSASTFRLRFGEQTVLANGKEASRYTYEKAVGKNLFQLDVTPPATSFWLQILLVSALILMMTGTMFVIIYRQYHQILKVIGNLQEKVNRVVHNDNTVDFHSDYDDELGRLSNDIQVMVKHLKEANQALYETQLENERINYSALVKQFDSHFLYNTLSFLNWRSYSNRDTEMSELIQKLSTYYRASLNKGKTEIILKNELENVKVYLEIRQTLNPDLFTTEFVIDPTTEEIPVINLLLQPLVENAIEHAFSEEDKAYKITIKAEKKADRLILLISDNGEGMDAKTLTKIQEDKTGYGLANTRKRVKYYFGEEGIFKIYSIKKEGTTIKLDLPIKNKIN